MPRILIACFLLACSLGAQAQEKMLYVEYRVLSPQLPADSPETQTRKLWLVGKKYMRFEDILNPQTRIHGLIIVSEPDIRFIDRTTNSGQHSVDPGPTYAVHFPMLASESSPKLKQLEFGNELAFFQENGARQMPAQTVDGVSTRVLGLEMEDRELRLFLRRDGHPLQVTVKADTYQYTVRILRYEPGLEPDFSLFKLPSGVTINK
jgi:hypothetical protein